jgi:hypothetical protein
MGAAGVGFKGGAGGWLFVSHFFKGGDHWGAVAATGIDAPISVLVAALRIKKMEPVPVIRSAMGRSLPMPNSERRPHSLALERDHVAASGRRSSFGRDACFPAMGVLARAAMWWAYLWRKTAWAEWRAGRGALRAKWRVDRRARLGMGRRARVAK